MIQLTTFLTPDHIYPNVVVSSKKRALELIGKLVTEILNKNVQDDPSHFVCPVECFSNLFKREKLGSTALNNGVALPHAKLPANMMQSLDKPIAIFMQLEQPIDYEAQDNKAVDLIYAVLFSEEHCTQYRDSLQLLADHLTDKNLLKHLRTANSAEEIWHILNYIDRHHTEN